MNITGGVICGLAVAALAAAPASAQQRITSGTPSLGLRPGDPARSLTLSGADLDRVTRARVVRDGQLVPGIEVVLDTGLTSTRGVTRTTGRELTLRLRAGSAVPVGSYQLELLTLQQAIPVAVVVAVPPPTEPSGWVPSEEADLMIEQCDFIETQGEVVARILIRNIGLRTASFSRSATIALLQTSAYNPVMIPAHLASAATIPSFGTAELRRSAGRRDELAAGSYLYRWRLNPSQQVPEDRGHNNERSCTLNVP